jgi:hypothetical protein
MDAPQNCSMKIDSSKSSTKGSKNRSKSFPGDARPRISKSIMKFDSSMHSHGGRLYGTTNTGHMLYFVFFSKNGLKLSVARPSLRFLACHTRFLCQNQVLIICMTQDQFFHTYGQKCSQYPNVMNKV